MQAFTPALECEALASLLKAVASHLRGFSLTRIIHEFSIFIWATDIRALRRSHKNEQ
jgi:hypothetical protein